jgi:hypothetical protein
MRRATSERVGVRCLILQSSTSHIRPFYYRSVRLIITQPNPGGRLDWLEDVMLAMSNKQDIDKS